MLLTITQTNILLFNSGYIGSSGGMTLFPGGPYASGFITLVWVSWYFVFFLSLLICTDNSFVLVLSVVCYLFVSYYGLCQINIFEVEVEVGRNI